MGTVSPHGMGLIMVTPRQCLSHGIHPGISAPAGYHMQDPVKFHEHQGLSHESRCPIPWGKPKDASEHPPAMAQMPSRDIPQYCVTSHSIPHLMSFGGHAALGYSTLHPMVCSVQSPAEYLMACATEYASQCGALYRRMLR